MNKRAASLARQEQDLQRFIQDNPSDASLWPNPFGRYRKAGPGRKKKAKAEKR